MVLGLKRWMARSRLDTAFSQIIPPNESSTSQIKSINQEIFKQIRYKLDSNMRDYNARVERGEVKKVV
jgi:hypothetical protein